jgi:predicted DCC family thiol-disulfide oxidoreductase YuxK
MVDQPDNQEPILIYDAECRLCVAAKAGLESRGPRMPLRFVPYQCEEAARRLGEAYRPGRPDAAFLVGADGNIQRGLDAFLSLLPGLPAGRFLAILARWSPFRSLARGLYSLVAAHRYRLFGAVRTSDPEQSSASQAFLPPGRE